MGAFQKSFRISTKGNCDIRNIQEQVQQIVRASGIQTGIANVSARGSTVGITTLEYEPGCVADLQRALDKIAPAGADYTHHLRWGDNNGHAHLRSALIGTAMSFPVREGKIHTGTWQQIVLCDFDDRPREREVIVTVVGD